ncbi:NAD-dependent epimerase/dehydratase family protein [Candidatus Marinimicrobia bacterium]|nr:NAD-dependent epimerase/dehydratase family protein [Candidatus Neomarinimicrobiota bacterium]
MKNILVTGGTSYIGKHVIAQLIEKNYSVRTTIRDKEKSDEIKSDIEKHLGKDITLDIHTADLLKDDGWDEAIKGCDAIIHVAGPFPIGYDGGEKELTGPHQDGALRVFRLAKDNSINRIILTSSVVSIWMDSTIEDTVRYIDETNWSDLNDDNLDAYTKGKALKEKAAWDFVAEHDSIKLTTILPSVVLGPGIGKPVRRGSMELFMMLINKEMPVAPPLKVGMVDVRDVAKMHIAALENDESIGKRVILAENTYWMKEFGEMLRELGHNAPTFSPPVWFVKFMANFDKTIKPVKPMLGVDINFNTEVARSILKYDPVPIKKTIKDTSDYIKSYS